MIFAIENNDYMTESYDTDLFAGQSVSEMLESYTEFVAEACNDFQMDVLMTEHAYLLENGVEIEYFTEGEETKEGSSVKEKAMDLIKKVTGAVISALTNLGNAIKNAIGKLMATIKARGINKEKAMNGARFVTQKELNNITLTAKLKDDAKSVFDRAARYFETPHDTPESHFYENNVAEGKFNPDVKDAEKYVAFLFDAGILKPIEKAKKDAMKLAKSELATVKKAGNDEAIAKLKNRITYFSNTYKQAIKAYNLHFSNSVKVAKVCLKNPEGKENLKYRKRAEQVNRKFEAQQKNKNKKSGQGTYNPDQDQYLNGANYN